MHYSDDEMQRPKVDDSTFNRLVAPHVLAMLRTAAIIIGTSKAEDIVQEALIQAGKRMLFCSVKVDNGVSVCRFQLS